MSAAALNLLFACKRAQAALSGLSVGGITDRGSGFTTIMIASRALSQLL